MTDKNHPLAVVILAAGQGKRMRSDLPKVLQPLAGKPLLWHVLRTAAALDADETVVVYGHGGDAVHAAFADAGLKWALQVEQRGTGHAVQQAMSQVPGDARVLVLCGDVPLLTPATLEALLDGSNADGVAVLSVDMDDPTGYGRIVRDGDGRVTAIVEHRDASDDQRAIREINSGVIAAPAARLAGWLKSLKPKNDQGEYYLTDIVGAAVADGVPVAAVKAPDFEEVMGINNRAQLAAAERAYQRRAAETLMRSGAILADPARIDVRGRVSCGRDVFIDVNAVLIGEVELGDRVSIGPNAVITDSKLGAGTHVFANCVIEDAEIANDCLIGPFARMRPGVRMADKSKLGNFVEVKKSDIGRGSKVNHLTYIGDSSIGENVNVGAGTITCNYDGANKHRTIIGDGAFIGSGVELVAPVEIGAGATIGAGSTISKSAEAGKLTIERTRQRTIDGWERPVKKPT